ncbi:hypothetical protein [Catellatospora sp. NPDC049133]|uniref:hypothetical protein n=1 Tax=Catellatospora sp. NPDC049133 TaxID=3155499 RepID=UPI0033D67CF6
MPVTLRRTRTWLVQVLIALAAPVALAWALLTMRRDMIAGLPPAIVGRELIMVTMAAIAAPIVVMKTLGALRFRFVIDSAGLTIRTPDITAALPWSDIESVILDDLRILVVPDPGHQRADYPGIGRFAGTTSDGRSCFEVLVLSQVRESPAAIASALAEHAGPRFTDARRPARHGGTGSHSAPPG